MAHRLAWEYEKQGEEKSIAAKSLLEVIFKASSISIFVTTVIEKRHHVWISPNITNQRFYNLYRITAVKLGDGYVACDEEIIERK